jgi:hypothetical protein
MIVFLHFHYADKSLISRLVYAYQLLIGDRFPRITHVSLEVEGVNFHRYHGTTEMNKHTGDIIFMVMAESETAYMFRRKRLEYLRDHGELSLFNSTYNCTDFVQYLLDEEPLYCTPSQLLAKYLDELPTDDD